MEDDSPFPFGDDEQDELRRLLAEFVEQLQGAGQADRVDVALRLAVDLTVAGVQRIDVQGAPDGQAQQLRVAVATVLPEALALIGAALEEAQ